MLGLRQIAGLKREEADRLVAARTAGVRTLAELMAGPPVKTYRVFGKAL